MARKGDKDKKDGKTTRSSRSKEKEKDDADEEKVTYNPASHNPAQRRACAAASVACWAI